MRFWLRVFRVALVVSAVGVSARCADMGLGAYEASFAPSDTWTSNTVTAPPAAAPSAAPPAAPPQQCDPAQAAAATVSPFAGDLCERPLLLGDMCGARDALAAKGITINVDTYQFYQGVATGGIHDVFQYSGRNDYFVNIDGEKAGLWKGFFITLHGETRYGDTVNLDTGAILPVNTAELFPKATGSETALTGVKFTQALSENFVTFAGKLNMLDSLKMPFTGAARARRLLESWPVVSRRYRQNGTVFDSRGRSRHPERRAADLHVDDTRYQ